MEFQIELGLGLGLQRGVAPEELDLSLAVHCPGAWKGEQGCLVTQHTRGGHFQPASPQGLLPAGAPSLCGVPSYGSLPAPWVP